MVISLKLITWQVGPHMSLTHTGQIWSTKGSNLVNPPARPNTAEGLGIIVPATKRMAGTTGA